MRAHHVPAPLRRFLPDGDGRAPAERLADGRYLVAGSYALILLAADGVQDAGMWYEVQYARWEAATRTCTVVWVDPARPRLAVRTSSRDARRFMREVAEHVNHALVATSSVRLEGGTRVTAQVRRREDGELFSTLVADGPLDAAGEARADALEREVRESVGLSA